MNSSLKCVDNFSACRIRKTRSQQVKTIPDVYDKRPGVHPWHLSVRPDSYQTALKAHSVLCVRQGTFFPVSFAGAVRNLFISCTWTCSGLDAMFFFFTLFSTTNALFFSRRCWRVSSYTTDACLAYNNSVSSHILVWGLWIVHYFGTSRNWHMGPSAVDTGILT